MRAVVADPVGGPENLTLLDLPTPEPGPGEALVRLHSIGVNFIDVYFRMGVYKTPENPARLGNEGAGVVERTGANVELKPGQRVAYAMSRGSYAEYAVVPAPMLVPIPDQISFESAAAIMLQGMTAHYLTQSTFTLQPGNTCLVHAAAGGVGLLIVQIAKLSGARVIGTASTEEKASLIKVNGADEAIIYTQADFEETTRALTSGNGVDVVYDSVGRTTFAKSLNCLKPRGLLALFGQSSGPVGEFDPQMLNQKGSLFLTRPSLAHYVRTPEELKWRANDLFRWIEEGKLKIRIQRTYKLGEAAQAHRDLESRATSGKLLLIP
jgi:NADPH2:quinone reductase